MSSIDELLDMINELSNDICKVLKEFEIECNPRRVVKIALTESVHVVIQLIRTLTGW